MNDKKQNNALWTQQDTCTYAILTIMLMFTGSF